MGRRRPVGCYVICVDPFEPKERPTVVGDHRPPSVPPRNGFLLIGVEGAARGHTFPLEATRPGRALVGQGPACDFQLDDPQLSRRHVAFEVELDRLRINDLGSTNGTYVNGVRVGEAYLFGGERVRLGGAIVFLVEREVEPTPMSLSRATSFGRVVGASAEMRRLYPLCDKLAASTVPVIIEGETGTGKEILAEALHERGPLAHEPFVVFDCTAVPPNLVESELFGHERGSFTGAVKSRKGVFEQANGGTLLIDEIGDLALELQPKLLRALERSSVRRVGGDHALDVKVRILAATRRDLDHEVQSGLFRDDLFHRLAVARLELPPLRARHGDVPTLAAHFARLLGASTADFDPELLLRWADYTWPGNVRELRNAVVRQLVLGEHAHEGSGARRRGRGGDAIERVLAMDLPLGQARERVVDEFERRYVERALAKSKGVVTEAAKAAGVARRHFQRLRSRKD